MMKCLSCLMMALAAILPPGARAAQSPYTFRHPAMGTEFVLYLYAPDIHRAEALAAEVFDEVDRIEAELSNYQDQSELSRINHEAANASADAPVTTDPETFDFLAQSRLWSVRSDGAFDITVGALMKAWGFFRAGGRVPSAAELDALRPMVGYTNLELDPAARTVHFAHAGLELDPGGIGKGFAVDAAVRLLRSHGVRAALLSSGSSTIYALGAPPGQRGWRVVVPSADGSARTLSTLWLRDTSLSSANCREKNFTSDGHLYCHIMDPRLLRPVEGRLHVSIVHPSATASDALSNVLFVDSPAESLRFLHRYAPMAQAIIVSDDGGGPRCTLYRWHSAVNREACPTR